MTRRSRPAFTLVELLVVIGIIAILLAILMPVLRRARDQAMAVNCRSNLRQLTMAVLFYANEHKGYVVGPYGIIDPPQWSGGYILGISQTDYRPTATGWLATSGALKNPRVWLCPNDSRLPLGITYSYTYNGRMIVEPGHDLDDNPPLLPDPFLRKITTFKEPSRDIIFVEENTILNRPYPINDAFLIYYDVTDDRHMHGAQVGYLDGHADQIPANVALWSDRRYYGR